MNDFDASNDRVADAFDVPFFAELSTASKLGLGHDQDNANEIIKLPPLPELAASATNDAERPDISFDIPPLADIGPKSLDDDDGSTELDSLSESLTLDRPDQALDPPPGEDVWQLTRQLPSLRNEPQLLSWDTFSRPGTIARPRPLYLSEAGPKAFDASLSRHERQSNQPVSKPIQSKALLRSLWQLGLGRESTLFPFDSSRASFKQTLPTSHAHGVSLECSQDLVQAFLKMGNCIRRLRLFIDVCFTANGILPAVVTYAHAVDVVLSGVEAHATETVSDIHTLLQLQQHFRSVQHLLDALIYLAEQAEQSATEQRFLDTLFEFAERQQHESVSFRKVVEAVCARSASNWLRITAEQVGLTPTYDANDQDVSDESDEKKPCFINNSDAELIDQTISCLQHLKSHHMSSDLLSRLQTASTEEAKFDLGYTWDELDSIQSKAEKYHADVRDALLGLRSRPPTVQDSALNEDETSFDWEKADFVSDPDTRSELLDKLPALPFASQSDGLFQSVHNYLSDNPTSQDIGLEIDPPLSVAVSYSLRPLLAAQNHLVSYLAAHLLLHEQDLRLHVNLHYAFSFFASGLFKTRLQHVLFSADIEAAERQSGTYRKGSSGRGITTGMGLKLGTGQRQTWPPASSEIRLALMGLLGDVWREEQALDRPLHRAAMHRREQPSHSEAVNLRSAGDEVLPGNLSFSIRTDLPDETITRILNADSIAALDFLTLTYDPPAALEPLFSSRTLQLYDRVFGLWLRLIRVTSALSSIFDLSRGLKHTNLPPAEARQVYKLRHAAHTFISTLTSHLRIAGIDAPWAAFTRELDALALQCRDPVPPPLPPSHTGAQPQPQSQAPSLALLQTLHSRTIDRISANLLLRKKQVRAAVALEGVCEDVLSLARHLQQLVAGGGTAADDAASQSASLVEIDTAFDAHVADFRGACEALVNESERHGDSSAVEEDGIACTKDLLAVLDGQDHKRRRNVVS